MDALDRKILAQLQRDASLTNAQLSEKVALSPSSCLRRVKRLKADGMIDTVVALCNPAALGRGLTAIVEVYLVHDAIAKCREFMANVMREDAFQYPISNFTAANHGAHNARLDIMWVTEPSSLSKQTTASTTLQSLIFLPARPI